MWAVVWFGFRAIRVLALAAGPAAVVLAVMAWGLVFLGAAATVHVLGLR
jgi:hypothetical protein